MCLTKILSNSVKLDEPVEAWGVFYVSTYSKKPCGVVYGSWYPLDVWTKAAQPPRRVRCGKEDQQEASFYLAGFHKFKYQVDARKYLRTTQITTNCQDYTVSKVSLRGVHTIGTQELSPGDHFGICYVADEMYIDAKDWNEALKQHEKNKS